jgi:hypothetical protein
MMYAAILAVMYLSVGVAIQKGRGQTGKYLFPNRDLWANCCGLVKDGFGFFRHEVVLKQAGSYQPYESL